MDVFECTVQITAGLTSRTKAAGATLTPRSPPQMQWMAWKTMPQGGGLALEVCFPLLETTVAKSQSWGQACSPAPTEASRGAHGHSHTHSVPATSGDEGSVTIFSICFHTHALKISPRSQRRTPALKGDLPSSRPEGHLGGHSHTYVFSGRSPLPVIVDAA